MAARKKSPAVARVADTPAVAPVSGFATPATSSPGAYGVGVSLYDDPNLAGNAWQWRHNLSADIATMLSRQKYRALLSDARAIVETFDIVAEAIQQKAEYVCQARFAPSFAGKDHAWGAAAREVLIEAHKAVNVRGPLFSWDKSWQIASTAPDTDGGCFVLFGETETGFPQFQFLEAHRVGSRCADGLVNSGPYAGSRLLNGIFYDANGREIGYRVLGPTAAEDRDISARDMMHVAIPRWLSDGRPIPNIAYGLLSLYGAQRARGFQLTKQQVNSAHTITEETPDGKPPGNTTIEALRVQNAARAALVAGGATPAAAAAAVPAAGSSAAPIIQSLAGGLIRYVKSGAGSIKSHIDNTPGDGWLEFDQRMIDAAIIGIGWSYYMLDLSKFGGAATRGFQDQINSKIYARWLDLTPFILRAELILVSKLIARGDIPQHAEWWKWIYIPPADFTVDGGRANRADLDNCRAGIESRPHLIGRTGKIPEEVLRAEARYRQQQAEIEKEFGLPPGSLATLTPLPKDNPSPAPEPVPAGPPPPAT